MTVTTGQSASLAKPGFRTPGFCLPHDLSQALLVGRVWRQTPEPGPAVVVVRDGELFDVTVHASTMSDLLDEADVVGFARRVRGEPLGRIEHVLQAALHGAGRSADPRALNVLAPCDLQVVKASGVTFTISLLERMIEERAGGNPERSHEIRSRLNAMVGIDLETIKPGSPEAECLKQELIRRDAWSHYLEVGIGPDAEIFSKAPVLSSVGFGDPVGLHPDSQWNNSEPEIVLAVASTGRAVGATLGNDVNLRDIEGRSALLLGRAKDNNGSCALGPFIRLFDDRFTMDTVRRAEVSLHIRGEDGFELRASSHMRQISRDPEDLVRQACGAHHQYPDGFMLFLGTMFSPSQDRNGPGQGFTHHLGDVVTIFTPSLGALVNEVQLSTKIPPWTFGIRLLLYNLARRGKLGTRKA